MTPSFFNVECIPTGTRIEGKKPTSLNNGTPRTPLCWAARYPHWVAHLMTLGTALHIITVIIGENPFENTFVYHFPAMRLYESSKSVIHIIRDHDSFERRHSRGSEMHLRQVWPSFGTRFASINTHSKPQRRDIWSRASFDLAGDPNSICYAKGRRANGDDLASYILP